MPDVLCLNDLSTAQAGGADAHTFVARTGLGMNRAEVDVPAPLGHVMRVTDVIARARLLAADLTYLCHSFTPENCRTGRVNNNHS